MATPRTIAKTYSQTAHYAEIESRSGTGAPTYGTPVSFLCRVETGVLDSASADGRTRDVVTTVLTDTAVPVGAIVWLPDEDQTDVDKGNVPKRIESSPALAVRGGAWTEYMVVL